MERWGFDLITTKESDGECLGECCFRTVRSPGWRGGGGQVKLASPVTDVLKMKFFILDGEVGAVGHVPSKSDLGG